MRTLFMKNTTAILYGRKSVSIQRMLDFDYFCKRKPSVAAVVDPTSSAPEKVFYGEREFMIPVYQSLEDAKRNSPATDVLVNFASMRSAGAVVHEGIERGLRVIATIAEGVPERDSRSWIAKASKKTVGAQHGSTVLTTGAAPVLIGPATVGAVTAGAFRIGDTGGSNDHLLKSKLHRPGCVGYVGKSGGMSNEMYRMIAENSSGIVEGVAIGGDRYPGSHFLSHLLRYEANPDITFLVCLSEIGGREEEEIAEALNTGTICKPLIAWVAGTSAEFFPKDVQFGHAGAFAGSKAETAVEKNTILREAGALVPESFEGLPGLIAKTYATCRSSTTLRVTRSTHESTVPAIPDNRRHSSLQCTISDDRGEEPSYAPFGAPKGRATKISQYIQSGDILPVIAALWWKTELPPKVLKYLEMILIAVADHGPCPAGAHNAIVAATAGKDPISALCSGLLTIGPRFGGAVDAAARTFSDAHNRKLTPQQFVDEMKLKGERIPGIGHRIKSLHHPDTRVKALLVYAKKNFKKLPLTNVALQVEKITTSKKPNLILNVDGTIAVTLIDVLLPKLPKKIQETFFDTGYLNGLFALGRSIGILGHVFDQKRLQTPLYRHPQEDVLYGEGILSE